MGRRKQSARLRRWRGLWYVFYRDHGCNPPVERRVSCEAHDALTEKQRKALLAHYLSEEVNSHGEAVRHGGRLAFDTPLDEEISAYLKDVDERVELRALNPEARGGLSTEARRVIRQQICPFLTWLQTNHPGLQTGSLTPHELRRYVEEKAAEPTRLGYRDVMRSPTTLNIIRRNIRTALGWIEDRRPRRFPDFAMLKKALAPQHVPSPNRKAPSPEQLSAFLRAAITRESPDYRVVISRVKAKKRERFLQAPACQAQTSVSRLFLVLALTGCRLSDALTMKWEQIDFEFGHVNLVAHKTGRATFVPLAGAPEGELAPRFMELLKRWKEEAGERKFVLPSGDLPEPAFPKGPWKQANDLAKVRRIGPQILRRAFTSYCASLGLPPAVVAMWQAHGGSVAEKWYRQQVPTRGQGTLEEAMGLRPLIDELLEAE